MKRSPQRTLIRRLRRMRLNGLTSWSNGGGGRAGANLNAQVAAMIRQPDWRQYLWLAWDALWFGADDGKEIKS